MQEFLDLILVDGNFLETFVRLFVLCLSFDCLIGVANAIKSIKGVAS